MRAIAVQEVKRRGLSFLKEDLNEGPVHIIQNNNLQYVLLTEERYRYLVDAENEVYVSRIKKSLQEVKEKKTKRGTARQLIKEIGLEN